MSGGMPPRPNFSSSSSKLSAVKGYISQRNVPSALQRGVTADGAKQTWKEWAGQKISAARGQNNNSQDNERIALFPGWATRRYHQDAEGRTQEAFDVELFVSGFASSHRAPELASRSQRAFMRLAKGFAALPKLDGSGQQDPPLTRSTEDLLAAIKLPPRPTEITEEFEVEALERQFQRINNRRESSFDDDEDDASVITSSSSASSSSASLPGDIRRLHRNLEARIQPFWSSVLPSRTVRLNIFCSPLKDGSHAHSHNPTAEEQDALEHGPVAARELTTGIDGSFQARVRIPWEELCQHPGALHVAFGDPLVEHELLVTAALFPAPTPAARLTPTPPAHDALETKTLRVTLTHCPVRVISDIDDTVKAANIMSGARAIFHNVFVKEYKDLVIPGMGEWYTGMWKRGVRFHYVSNGPFELLPLLVDFFPISGLPPGSIKLRSYAGRSLFSGLLSAPAARKRAGVQDILQAFPESKFILIGDSGEQDLELYAELARERPEQILAVFIRDVETGERLEDPTGWNAVHASTTTTAGTMLDNEYQKYPHELWPPTTPTIPPRTPPAYSVPSPGPYKQYFTAEPEPIAGMSTTPNTTPRLSNGRVPSINTNTEATLGPSSSGASIRSLRTPTSAASFASPQQQQQRVLLEGADRRRAELQMRVWRARAVIPTRVPLRVFREPGECKVEAEGVLAREKL